MKSRWTALGLGLCIGGAALLLTACGSSSSSGSSDSGSGTRGGTYRVESTDFGFSDNFDPTGEYTTNAWGIYRGLLIRTLVGYRMIAGTPGNQLVPDLATSVPTSTDDGLTWTFTLKSGVRFAPPVNRAITSHDIVTAFERIANPALAAQYGFYYTTIAGMNAYASGTAKTISGITTPNDQTVVFHLTTPTPDFLYRLSLPATGPIPEEVAKCFTSPGDYGRDLVSSGPYMIQGADKVNISSCSTIQPMSGFDPTSKLILVRNPNYNPSTDSTVDAHRAAERVRVHDQHEPGRHLQPHQAGPGRRLPQHTAGQHNRNRRRQQPEGSHQVGCRRRHQVHLDEPDPAPVR